jgi:hypothetical protein
VCDVAGAAGLKSDATIKLRTTWTVVAHSLFRTLAVEVWTAEAGGCSLSCIVHNAFFSNLLSGKPTASHQRRFLGCSKIRVL